MSAILTDEEIAVYQRDGAIIIDRSVLPPKKFAGLQKITEEKFEAAAVDGGLKLQHNIGNAPGDFGSRIGQRQLGRKTFNPAAAGKRPCSRHWTNASKSSSLSLVIRPSGSAAAV